MKARGMTTWFAMDSMIHLSPQVLDLAARLGLDVDTTVGKLARVESGDLGQIPDRELAAVLRWKKKPSELTEALLAAGVMTRTEDGSLFLPDWYETNGKSTEKARKDRERKNGTSRATEQNRKEQKKTPLSEPSPWCKRRETDANQWMDEFIK